MPSLRRETSVVEAARTHGLTVADVEDWRERFLAGADNALRSRPTDDVCRSEAGHYRMDSPELTRSAPIKR